MHADDVLCHLQSVVESALRQALAFPHVVLQQCTLACHMRASHHQGEAILLQYEPGGREGHRLLREKPTQRRQSLCVQPFNVVVAHNHQLGVGCAQPQVDAAGVVVCAASCRQ